MKASDRRGSYPSPLWGLRRASLAHGGWPKFYLGQSGGVATTDAVLGATPTPASASDDAEFIIGPAEGRTRWHRLR
jgi:hypothetical protein